MLFTCSHDNKLIGELHIVISLEDHGRVQSHDPTVASHDPIVTSHDPTVTSHDPVIAQPGQ